MRDGEAIDRADQLVFKPRQAGDAGEAVAIRLKRDARLIAAFRQSGAKLFNNSLTQGDAIFAAFGGVRVNARLQGPRIKDRGADGGTRPDAAGRIRGGGCICKIGCKICCKSHGTFLA